MVPKTNSPGHAVVTPGREVVVTDSYSLLPGSPRCVYGKVRSSGSSQSPLDLVSTVRFGSGPRRAPSFLALGTGTLDPPVTRLRRSH